MFGRYYVQFRILIHIRNILNEQVLVEYMQHFRQTSIVPFPLSGVAGAGAGVPIATIVMLINNVPIMSVIIGSMVVHDRLQLSIHLDNNIFNIQFNVIVNPATDR